MTENHEEDILNLDVTVMKEEFRDSGEGDAVLTGI